MLTKAARAALAPSRSAPVVFRHAKRSYVQHSIHLPEIGDQTKDRKIFTFVPEQKTKKQLSQKPHPSLKESFPGVLPEAVSVARRAPETKISTLPNGIRVASEENFSQMTGVGVFVQTGTRFETEDNYGSSMMLERLAFKVRFLLISTVFFHWNFFHRIMTNQPRLMHHDAYFSNEKLLRLEIRGFILLIFSALCPCSQQRRKAYKRSQPC
jgi:hypothetical protein